MSLAATARWLDAVDAANDPIWLGPWATTFGRVIPTVAMGQRFNSDGSRPGFPVCGLSSE